MPEFNQEKFTIIIPVHGVDEFLKPVQDIIDVNEFRIKPEFHMTLVGFARGREVLQSITRQGRNKSQLLEEVDRLLKSIHLTVHINKEWFYISKEVKFTGKPTEFRESIIATVTIEHLDAFWNQLEQITGCRISKPFPHVTLATRGTGSEQAWEGIGIKDEADFNNLDKQKIER